MKKIVLAITFLITTIFAYAQPANDNCSFAQLVVLPPSGNICFPSTNALATPDALPTNSCNGPTGGNEVWYSFITTGTQNTISVLPIAPGAASSMVVSVPNGNCTSPTTLVCNAAVSPGGPATVNFSVPIGTQIWFEVSSLGASGSFNLCVTSVTPVPFYNTSVGDSCATAIRLCNKASFTGDPPPIFSNSGQQISCYTFPAAYLSDLWYKFKVAKTGTLEFLCTPQVGLDIDWEVLNVTAGCSGAPVIACNYTYNGAGGDPTGMDATTGTPCGGAGHICNPVTVLAGNTYAIHLNYTNPSLNTFDMTFGGTFQIAPFPDFYVDAPGGCAPHITDFTDSSYSASTYNWSFGNGSTFIGNNPPPQNYPTAGNYVVGLVVNDAATGCVNSTARQVQVGTGPTSTFTVSQSPVCIGINDTITYTGNGGPLSTFSWSFSGATIVSGSGSGPYIVQWSTNGSKTVSLTVTENGCQSTVTNATVNVQPPPTSTFNMPTGACTGDTVLITYSGNAGASAIYYWSLGNSFIASTNGVDTFYVVWNTAGSDSVFLQIDQNGCISNKTTKYITILSKPIASFTLTDSICSSGQALATFTGAVPLTSQFDWNFGTGVASPGGTVIGPHNITFSSAGYNIISLIVNDQGCKSAEVFDSVFVTVAPTATFTISDDSLCGAETATINYTGTGGPTAIYNYNFGTATINSGSGSGPYNISYATAGKHYVTLSVTENGCTSTVKTDSIVSAADAIADAGSDVTYCNGDSALIGATSTVGYTYSWSPATAVSKSNISNPYAIIQNNTNTATTTSVILTAKNIFCIDKDTVKVTVNPRLRANISVSPAISQCLDVNNFSFTNNAPAITGSTYNWDFTPFANIPTATSPSVNNVSYSVAGNYLIQLTTATGTCPIDKDTITITVTDAAKADFIADDTTGCPPVDVIFTDKSTGVLPGSTYFWTFGNGTTSTLANPVMVSYTSGGSYTVTLSITSPNGCVSTKTKTNYITVYNQPVASFTPDPYSTNILQPVISFYGTSTNADTCKYSFGDGSTGLGCFTQHEYLDTGTFVVMLIVTNKGGCSDTAYQTVIVNDFYTLYVPNTFTPNGDGNNDYFSIYGFGIKTFSINVYNRQGAIVYTSSNSDFVWDGKDTNGRLLMEGNYVYQIEVKDVLNKSHTINGSLLIIM